MDTKEVVVRHIEGLAFVGKGRSQHYTVIDAGGAGVTPAATGPMEMILMALAGCTGSDVVSILRKKRLNLSGLEIIVTGDRAEEHPKIFTKIHVQYVFTGEGIPPRDVEQAIELSVSKYCSVSAMLAKSAPLTHAYTIVESKIHKA